MTTHYSLLTSCCCKFEGSSERGKLNWNIFCIGTKLFSISLLRRIIHSAGCHKELAHGDHLENTEKHRYRARAELCFAGRDDPSPVPVTMTAVFTVCHHGWAAPRPVCHRNTGVGCLVPTVAAPWTNFHSGPRAGARARARARAGELETRVWCGRFHRARL